MKPILFFATTLVLVSCGSGNDQGQITGAYAREYSFDQRNLYADGVIGQATVRDTIFIKAKEQGYEISNHTWRRNDYDDKGWRDQKHTQDPPRFTYEARYDKTDFTLIAVNGFYPPILLDLKGQQLFLNDEMKYPYKKIK